MILDTNFFIKYCLEPTEDLKNLIADSTLNAPDFLKLEICNVLRKLHFFQKVPLAQIDEFEFIIISLISEFVPDSNLLNTAKMISYQLNHPIYDCIFLALAIETNDVFCSYDKKIIAKADQLGIRTMDLSDF